MECVEVKLFTDGSNDVVRRPARRFPGVLIQGVSLHTVRSDLAEVIEACERGYLADALVSAGRLLEGLDALLTCHADVLHEHEIPRRTEQPNRDGTLR
ncbi:DUF6959 family protein [Streptomyces sp. NPDC051286]|uniref:DUF6959 family protein n=1 Tax=Streptomyces sp. NPDC051286 TaxID=3365647 RepID=UPI00378F642F